MRKFLTLCLTVLLVMAMFVPAMAEGVYPLCENLGDVTLKIMVVAHPAIIDWQTNEMSLWMEQQTNVKVEFQTVPLEGKAEAVQMALAGGDYPDAFMFPYSDTINAKVLNKYGVNEKRLAVLNDLIPQHMPNLQKALDENPGYEDMLKMLDGNIYVLPEINQCYHCTVATKMWINQSWLDTLGLPMPTTTEEFYNTLVAFRDKDPNGNGIQDEIPMAGSYIDGRNTMVEYFLMNSFTYYNCYTQANQTGIGPIGFYLDGDTVKTPFAEPAFLEGLTWINKMVAEGLIYDGSFTANYESLTSLVENPDAELVGCVPAGYGGQFCDMAGERYGHFRPVMPLKGPAGVQQIPVNPYDLGLSGVIINADSANIEAVCKWVDLLYSFDGTIRSYEGVLDKNWRVPTEGEVGINGKPALYTELIPWQETEPQNDHWVQAGVDYRNSDFRLGMTSEPVEDLYNPNSLETLLYQVSSEMMQYADPTKYMPPVKFSTEDEDAMSVAKVEVGNLIKECIPAFLSGTMSIENDYQTFLSNLDAAGLPGLTEKYQAAYDAQFKK